MKNTTTHPKTPTQNLGLRDTPKSFRIDVYPADIENRVRLHVKEQILNKCNFRYINENDVDEEEAEYGDDPLVKKTIVQLTYRSDTICT